MLWPLVILDEPFANLRGRHPHDRILRSVVRRVSGEHVVANRPLFQRFGRIQGVLDGVAQKYGKALAVAEQRARENPAELFANDFGLGRRLRRPGRRQVWLVSSHGPLCYRPRGPWRPWTRRVSAFPSD